MFGVTVQLMSDRELGRFEVLRELDQRRLTTPAAAQLLGLERRQVFRLLKAYRAEGAAGLISKRRGGSSNRRKPEELRTKVLAIIRKRYWDFGPTLAAEKLREGHDITLGRETLRLWMIEARIWADRKQRRQQVHQPRHRRECIGELVQVDGCEHWWFEDRGPQCTLLVFVDDATSRLMHLQFVESESTFAYFQAARAYLEAWGKPVAFYSDKHGVFRVNHPGALGGDGIIQFGRALHALNIDIICANSSPAKGRVERAHKTFAGPAGQGIAAGRGIRFGRGERPAPGIHGRLQHALCQSAVEQQGFAPAAACRRRSRRRVYLEGGAHPVAGADPAIRQGALHPGAERAGQGGNRQAGYCGGLSRWPAGDPLQGLPVGLPRL